MEQNIREMQKNVEDFSTDLKHLIELWMKGTKPDITMEQFLSLPHEIQDAARFGGTVLLTASELFAALLDDDSITIENKRYVIEALKTVGNFWHFMGHVAADIRKGPARTNKK